MVVSFDLRESGIADGPAFTAEQTSAIDYARESGIFEEKISELFDNEIGIGIRKEE
jgi:hypothetical protein